MIAACDGDTRLLDRSVVLLLARLGLRASEPAHLRFTQIDWTGAMLTVSGKARGRPRMATERLFLTNIAPGRVRRPRIHDLRHTFAARALEQCGANRGEVARHFVALSTYLGHVDIRHTYWYL